MIQIGGSVSNQIAWILAAAVAVSMLVGTAWTIYRVVRSRPKPTRVLDALGVKIKIFDYADIPNLGAYCADILTAAQVYDKLGAKLCIFRPGWWLARVTGSEVHIHPAPFHLDILGQPACECLADGAALLNGASWMNEVHVAHRDSKGRVRPFWWVGIHEWKHMEHLPHIDYDHTGGAGPWDALDDQHVQAVKDTLADLTPPNSTI